MRRFSTFESSRMVGGVVWRSDVGGMARNHRDLELDVEGRTGCAGKEVVGDGEVRVLGPGEECMQRIGGLSPEEVINFVPNSIEAGRGKVTIRTNFDMNEGAAEQVAGDCEDNVNAIKRVARVDQLNTATAHKNLDREIQHSPEHFISNEDISGSLRASGNVYRSKELGLDRPLEFRRIWPDGLVQSRRNRPANDLEPAVVLIDATKPKPGRGEAAKGRNLVKSRANLSSEAVPSSTSSENTTREDTTPLGHNELVQSQEGNVPQNDPPGSSGTQERGSQYPVPLSPLSGEVARGIEYKRAMVAENAMKCGPAITRSEVLFEDEWLLIINKPCGIYSEHILATVPMLVIPASRQSIVSPLSHLTLRHPVDNSSGPHFHLANRLDRDTSGVMVITKCRNAAGKLSNIFIKRQVQKSYIALCRGARPAWTRLTVDSGHGRSRFGAWRVYSKLDVGRGLPGGSVVRDMTTHLLVLAINKQIVHHNQVSGKCLLEEFDAIDHLLAAGDEYSSGMLQRSPSDMVDTPLEESSDVSQLPCSSDEIVIRAIPLTGRTHQIRLHCQFVGLPLRGDVKYGGPHILGGVRYDHHALHAESLSFKHPFTFEDLHFVAPLPPWATNEGVQPLV